MPKEKPYAVSFGQNGGDMVVALIADPGEPLVSRTVVNQCAVALEPLGLWPTVTNRVPHTMRPGDVIHAWFTDLSFIRYQRDNLDTPTGHCPLFVTGQMNAPRQVPQLHVYLNKWMAENHIYKALCNELRHLLLATFTDHPNPVNFGHEPPGRAWTDEDEIKKIGGNFVKYLDNLMQTTRTGKPLRWPTRPKQDYREWDVVDFWTVRNTPLP